MDAGAEVSVEAAFHVSWVSRSLSELGTCRSFGEPLSPSGSAKLRQAFLRQGTSTGSSILLHLLVLGCHSASLLRPPLVIVECPRLHFWHDENNLSER